MTKKALTAAQRQKKRREFLTSEGFAQRNAWVHKQDQERYDAFIETLRKPSEHDRDRHHEQH